MQKQIRLREQLGLTGSSLEVMGGATGLAAVSYSSPGIAYPAASLAFAGLCLDEVSGKLKENLQEQEKDLEGMLSNKEKEFAKGAKVIKTRHQELVNLHKELSLLSKMPTDSE